MKDWVEKRAPPSFPALDFESDGSEAWKRYLASCSDYLQRQMVIYQNWPQRRFSAVGYSKEKVFRDQNA